LSVKQGGHFQRHFNHQWVAALPERSEIELLRRRGAWNRGEECAPELFNVCCELIEDLVDRLKRFQGPS
jgi:hypothetical protein